MLPSLSLEIEAFYRLSRSYPTTVIILLIMAYQHTNSKGQTYFLHSKDVTLRGSGKRQTIYFFSKSAGDGELEELPSGYQVVESQRTGLPVLKRS